MNITEFLNRKYFELQAQANRRITIEEFAKVLEASKGLMTMWLNGKRKPGARYKERIIKLYGEEAIIAFGDDPDLYAIQKAWEHISPKDRKKFRTAIEKAAEET